MTVGAAPGAGLVGPRGGQAPDPRTWSAQGIRNLFATKKFADVFVYRQDVPGGVQADRQPAGVPPHPHRSASRGNRKVKEKDLREAFPVQVGQFANPAVIRRDLQPLRELYYEKGYYNVVINTDSTVVDANNMEDLVVSIERGPQGQGQVHQLRRQRRTSAPAACAAP